MADDLKHYIRNIPDFPKPGIMFRDITTLLASAEGFRLAVAQLVAPFVGGKIDYVAGIEARGFILGGAVAEKLGCGFIPIRKKGKLPFATIGQDYALEYGVDRIEIHADAIEQDKRILLVDDLIATGGTAVAAVELIRQSGGHVVAAGFVINLPDLGGTRLLAQKQVASHCLVEFAGH